MKAQQIEFKEIDAEHLGSDKEYQIPPTAPSNPTNKSAKSWQPLRQVAT